MPRGRPPKPTALHLLEGTFNVTRHKKRTAEPKPDGDLGAPPDWLTPSQREGWDYALRHAPKGLLKMLDRGLLGLWVTAEDRHREAELAQAELNRRSAGLPFLIRGANGLEISPYIDIIGRTAKIMIQTSDRLGFSPVARPRIQVEPDEPPDPEGGDTWGALRRFPVIDGGKKA